jgi:hypothetical protein
MKSLSTHSPTAILLPLLLPLAFSQSAIAYEASKTIALTTRPSPPPEEKIGIDFESYSGFNSLTFTQTWVNYKTVYQQTGVEYKQAYCPDRKHHYKIPSSVYGSDVIVSSGSVTPYRQGHPKVKAYFVSAKTPPAPGLRVIVRNQTIGTETVPYTDREYDRSLRSEGFNVAQESEHKSKYLAVVKGENRMTYEIKRGDQVIDSGEFQITIGINDQFTSVVQTLPREVVTIPCPEKEKHEHRDGDRHDRHDRHRDRDRR